MPEVVSRYEADKLRHVEAKQWKAAGVIPYIFSEKDNELLILFGLVKVPNTNQREIYPLGAMHVPSTSPPKSGRPITSVTVQSALCRAPDILTDLDPANARVYF